MDFQVILIDPSTRQVSFKIQPKVISGVLKLTQIVLLSLLNIPGQDIFDPESGGGLPELIGFNFAEGELAEIAAEITRRVRKSETEVMNQQIGLDIPPNERLREVQIISIEEGEQIDEINVILLIVNELGQQLDVVI